MTVERARSNSNFRGRVPGAVIQEGEFAGVASSCSQ
jgi:hypothetical protein